MARHNTLVSGVPDWLVVTLAIIVISMVYKMIKKDKEYFGNPYSCGSAVAYQKNVFMCIQNKCGESLNDMRNNQNPTPGQKACRDNCILSSFR